MAASDAARPKAAFVYMVRCTDGTLYTGWSTDPAARLRAHQSGKGARYTRAKGRRPLPMWSAVPTSPPPCAGKQP